MSRSINDKTEQDIAVHRDVYALGLAVYGSNHLKNVCRTALQEMEGMDFVSVPYSLAHSIFQTMEVAIRQKLSYLDNNTSLMVFDRRKGQLTLTDLGTRSVKRVEHHIRALI